MCHIPRACKSRIFSSIGVCSFVAMDVPQWIVGVLIRHEGNGSSRYLVGTCHLVDTHKYLLISCVIHKEQQFRRQIFVVLFP